MSKKTSVKVYIIAGYLALLLCSIPIAKAGSLKPRQYISAIGIIREKLIVGVNYWKGTPAGEFIDRDLPLFQDVGIKHIRLGGITPADLEKCDTLVNLCLENGINVIATFADEPNFGDYVYNMTNYFMGRISAWIVLNEANWNGYRGNPAAYVDQLKIAYTRAKEADPSVVILATNLLSTDSLSYLREMYENGAKDYFDGLAIDPYCVGVSPLEPNRDEWGHSFWEVYKFRDLMVEYGDEAKKIWITEMGWRTPDPYGWFYVGDGKGTVNETTQAVYIQQALELALTWPWLERYYHYEWMDSYDPPNGYFGLIRERYNPPYETKPSYQVVKDFIER